MGDLIRTSVGAGNSSLLSMSFWFNSPNDAQVLDCTGLFYNVGHLVPSQEDAAYPSVQVNTSGRTLIAACGSPAGMDYYRRRWVETDGANGGFVGAVDTMEIGTFEGSCWASFNSTGPTDLNCPNPFTGLPVVPNPMAALLPYDGVTYFTGVAIWSWTNAGGWSTFALQLQGRIDFLTSIGGDGNVIRLLTLAQAHVAEYAASITDLPGEFEHGWAQVEEVHASGQPSYPPPPTCTWTSKTNACAPLGDWNHAAIAIDVGHAGPYPTKDVFNPSDLKRGIMVINGVFANLNDSTNPSVDGVLGLNYTTGFNMDFSTTKIGIPYLNNDRASVGLPIWPYLVRMSNLQVWCGQYIDWTNANNFSKVVIINNNIGSPARLEDASGAFGVPTIRMNGDYLNFPINTGTGGAFTKDGTIRNFGPSPSYGP